MLAALTARVLALALSSTYSKNVLQPIRNNSHFDRTHAQPRRDSCCEYSRRMAFGFAGFALLRARIASIACF
jgi:hypothetical protein